MEEIKAVAAQDVAPLYRDVELPGMRRADGSPALVRCETIDAIQMRRILRTMESAIPETPPLPEHLTPEERAAALRERAAEAEEREYEFFAEGGRGREIIKAGCAISDGNGGWQRPAFYWGDPVPGAIDGRKLSFEDMQALALTCLALRGYFAGGGPAADLSFPVRRGVRNDGDGAVGDHGADRGVAEGSAAAP